MLLASLAALGTILFCLFFLIPAGNWSFIGSYFTAHFFNGLGMGLDHTVVDFEGKPYHTTYAELLIDPYVRGVVVHFWQCLLKAAVVGAFVFAGAVFIAFRYFDVSGKQLSADKFIRGNRLVSNQAYIKACRALRLSPMVIPAVANSKAVFASENYDKARLQALPLPKHFEVQHVLIHGTTGVGKSQLALHLVSQIKALPLQSKRVVVDVGCNLLPLLYNPDEDFILNPFDERTEFWDVWEEFKTEADFRNGAAYLIPMPSHINDPFWINAPRSILASTAYAMREDPKRSIAKLLDILLMIDLPELSEYLDESEARVLVSPQLAKTSLSIRGVLATYVQCLKYLIGTEKPGKPPFTLREWIQNEEAQGTLFICIPEDKREEMKGLVTLWISRVIEALLTMPENRMRRIYFICDEIGVMNKVEKLSAGLSLGRKNGLSFILGMQSYNQLIKTYGDHGARELIDLMSTRFYFKSNDVETAKFVSTSLGEEEVEISNLNRAYSGGEHMRQGVSMINQISTRPVVTPSEVEHLRNLECYLKTIGGLPATKLHLMLYTGKKSCVGFIPRALPMDLPKEKGPHQKAQETEEDTEPDRQAEQAKPEGKNTASQKKKRGKKTKQRKTLRVDDESDLAMKDNESDETLLW